MDRDRQRKRRDRERKIFMKQFTERSLEFSHLTQTYRLIDIDN